jgi:RNA polymerase sigma factor (sigma-70 family)
VWAPSDEALLAGVASGDARATTAFVRRYQARVFGLAHTMVGDRGTAEEIAQEAFLRAWRHADAYDPRRGQVATWLLAITRNLAIDRLRVKRPEPVDPSTLVRMVETAWGAHPQAAPEAAERGGVHAAVAALPEEQRRAVLLAVLFGFTAREIGELEGAPLGTAKTRIRTALMKLRAELEETADER